MNSLRWPSRWWKRTDQVFRGSRGKKSAWGGGGIFFFNVPFTHILWGTRRPICHFTGMETFGLSPCEETGRNTQTGWGGGKQCHRNETVGGGTYHCFMWRNKPKASVLPPTLTPKCRIVSKFVFHWSSLESKVYLPVSVLPALSEVSGPAWKRFAGLLQFACADFCISAGCRGKELNLVHENTCRRLHCPVVWGLFPAGFPPCLFVKECREVSISFCICRVRLQKISATSHLNREGKSYNRKSMN